MRRLVMVCAIALTGAIAFFCKAERSSERLTDGWEFKAGGVDADCKWQAVTVPHDWAIYGPFDRNNDLQCVAVEQNGETAETWKTGRTGGLPFIGKGAYRRTLNIKDLEGVYTLVFDGAMSNAKVSVNGSEAITWPYGYNSFYVDITPLLVAGENELLVELQNFDQQSRWYPGAGVYRNVHLIHTDRIHVPVWGTYITTPTITADYAAVRVETEIEGAEQFEAWPYGQNIIVKTDIIAPDGKTVASESANYIARGQNFTQNITVPAPLLWDTENPYLYTARTSLITDGALRDVSETKFGIREIEYIPEKGFYLNGVKTKFKGVCNHHDLGPLGAAVNEAAIRHQVQMLKDMGANAIRTSHNMPAPELVRVCDELGMMLMLEPFDDWGFRPKSPNGYGKVFEEWAERDITNMVKQYRSSPSVVMWSIGNEVPSQWGPTGIDELTMLQDLVHRLDPTRPVTCGMDQINSVLDNGFAAALDIPGFNYKPQYYDEAYQRLPQKLILGSETASTVSSRGMYFFPVEYGEHHVETHDVNHSNSYDNESCSWSNTPDIDFVMDDDREFVLGQFVWTGFDYLGEPSPYDTDAWPSHSSYFGIIDLASLPKDRYYLYRSVWNKNDHTLHVLPHWNFEGCEGLLLPVYVYTDYPEAELFVNGKSYGRQRKLSAEEYAGSSDTLAMQRRYRLMWDAVDYQPGELRVVAYDHSGNATDEKVVRTAGKPHHLVMTSTRSELNADGEDLAYITVQVADKEGNIVPTDTRLVKFDVSGNGTFRAAANGDPTCLYPFHEPKMPLFSGALTVIVQSADTAGPITVKATAKGVKSATLVLNTHI